MSLRQNVIPCGNIYYVKDFVCTHFQFGMLKDMFIYRRDSSLIRVTRRPHCLRRKIYLDGVTFQSHSLDPDVVCRQRGLHFERMAMGVI